MFAPRSIDQPDSPSRSIVWEYEKLSVRLPLALSPVCCKSGKLLLINTILNFQLFSSTCLTENIFCILDDPIVNPPSYSAKILSVIDPLKFKIIGNTL